MGRLQSYRKRDEKQQTFRTAGASSCRCRRQPVLLEETDFATIDEAAALARVNIAIGHSGGKFLTNLRGIPVVRVGFPIHDRIGGQRILSVGYAGTLAFLDRFTNTLLEAKYGVLPGRR